MSVDEENRDACECCLFVKFVLELYYNTRTVKLQGSYCLHI